MLKFPGKGQHRFAVGKGRVFSPNTNMEVPKKLHSYRGLRFFCSTIIYIIVSHVAINYTILQKGAFPEKEMRSFAVRGKCRGPPPVLHFLKFKKGGQAYGKGIQNPGLQEDVPGGRRGSD